MRQELKIQREWIESLLKCAERTDHLIGDNYEHKVKYGISELLGYIASAEDFLKQP